MYHRFDESKYPSTNIQMDIFKKHINIIKSSEYNFLNPNKLPEVYFNEKTEKKVLLTIDDGYISFYQNAWPYLRDNKIPFLIFISTEAIGKNGYMGWNQIKEIENINNQIESLDTINIDVLPLLDSMVNSLEKFISFDIPFLIEERQARVNELNELLSRADISTSEKFRKIFEAYQIEANFGRTIEAYSSYIDIKGEAKAVEFFRLGRIGLFYRTLDGNDSGYWNSNNSSWEHVGSKLSDGIKSALDVANRKTPPNFITLPIKPIN